MVVIGVGSTESSRPIKRKSEKNRSRMNARFKHNFIQPRFKLHFGCFNTVAQDQNLDSGAVLAARLFARAVLGCQFLRHGLLRFWLLFEAPRD